LGIDIASLDALRRAKWDNKNDSAHGLKEMLIFNELQFHFQGVDTPDATWKTLERVFGKDNQIRANQSEIQCIALNPNDFACIKYFLSKFKTLRLLLLDRGIKKDNDQLIFAILSKLGYLYPLFILLEATSLHQQNNKPIKGSKPYQPSSTPNANKGTKSKRKKTKNTRIFAGEMVI
jgi:hypothetical protein